MIRPLPLRGYHGNRLYQWKREQPGPSFKNLPSFIPTGSYLEVFHRRQLIVAEVQKLHFRNDFLQRRKPQKGFSEGAELSHIILTSMTEQMQMMEVKNRAIALLLTV